MKISIWKLIALSLNRRTVSILSDIYIAKLSHFNNDVKSNELSITLRPSYEVYMYINYTRHEDSCFLRVLTMGVVKYNSQFSPSKTKLLRLTTLLISTFLDLRS